MNNGKISSTKTKLQMGPNIWVSIKTAPAQFQSAQHYRSPITEWTIMWQLNHTSEQLIASHLRSRTRV